MSSTGVFCFPFLHSDGQQRSTLGFLNGQGAGDEMFHWKRSRRRWAKGYIWAPPYRHSSPRIPRASYLLSLSATALLPRISRDPNTGKEAPTTYLP